MADPEIQSRVIKHAQRDMAADPGMSHETTPPGARERSTTKLPRLGGQLAAMWREGIKDIRQAMHEVFFAQAEHAPEAGTPFNPTQMMTTTELRGDDYRDALRQHATRPKPDKDQTPSL